MYRYVDALVLRASLFSRGTLCLAAPDLAAGRDAWRSWLATVLAIPGFDEAVEHASPVLADRARAARDGRRLSDKDTRRVVLAVLKYLLRARSRATPFGLFAGVAPARLVDTGAAQLGEAHRPVARVPAEWLRTVVDGLERDPAVWPHLLVRANRLVHERDGRLVLPHRANSRADGPPGHVVVRVTRPVCEVMAAAEHPILVRDLVDKLTTRFGVDPATAHRLLAGLVENGLLITRVRPTMTDTNPLDTVVRTVSALGSHAADTGRPATLVALETARDAKARHDQVGLGAARADRLRELTAAMRAAAPTDSGSVGVDVRLDAEVDLPSVVATEAANAAVALARLAPVDTGGWAAWHGRFLERYGPHALVPVLDAVDPDTGLGFPAGYRDTSPPPPAALTDRDINLLALAQDAALRGQRELEVDDDMITRLVNRDAPTRVQPTTEITVRVEAPSIQAVACGEFRLTIVGVSRAAGTTTGRFLDLFDEPSRGRLVTAYRSLPTVTRDAVRAQISAPLPHTPTETVARSAQVLPYLIPLGECRPDSATTIGLDDLAVAADAQRLYLVWVSQRRVVEPVMLNAVEPVGHMLPVARFLSEAPTALVDPCLPFTWGAAARLPFLPGIRYGRCLLSPARWRLDPARLPERHADWPAWNRGLDRWLDAVGCPVRVYLGATDQRIELDLDHPAHRAVLRAQLDRGDPAILTQAPAPDADDWIRGHAHEIVIPLASAIPPVPAPRIDPPMVTVRKHGRLPGNSGHVYLKIYGHPDRHNSILTRHLPQLLDELSEQRWWFLRYRDPDPHLRIRLTGHNDHTDTAMATIAAWTRHLREAGLTTRTQLDTDYPETTRFGGPDALPAAENFFATDSAAVLSHLAALDSTPTLDARALTAASLLDLVTGAFDDTAEAMRWVITHTTNQPTAPDRSVYRQTLTLADPDGSTTLAGSHPTIGARWQRRREALRAYRHAADAVPLDALLLDLLHLHHVRMIGPDIASERVCLHLARAAALSWLARHRGSHATTA